MLCVVLVMFTIVSNIEARSSLGEKRRQFYEDIVPYNATFMEMYRQHHAGTGGNQKRADYAIPLFTCNVDVHFDLEPTTVHELHPSDINVIAAMGDSLTAGQGIKATNGFDLSEYRGESWSIGGDGDYYSHLTLPNIMKLFNPNIYGYSTGVGDFNSATSKLNVANPGDITANMPNQARLLVDRINSDANIDTSNDWKLITLFIGGNDLCRYCNDKKFYSETNYIKYIEQALDILHSGLRRTFVNLVMIFDIAPFSGIKDGTFCRLAQGYTCSCGRNSSMKSELLALTRKYQIETKLLVESGKYDTRKDFTVVVQPFFRDIVPPRNPNDVNEVDMSLFAPDCFHFSQKGHMAAALSLWNNMVEGLCEKKIAWRLNEPLYCPGKYGSFNEPFLTTYKNSQRHPYSCP